MIENYAISVVFIQKFSVVTSKSDSKFKDLQELTICYCFIIL